MAAVTRTGWWWTGLLALSGCAASQPVKPATSTAPTRVAASPPPRQVELNSQQTLFTVGAGQGVEVIGENVYLYGDAETGVIAEYFFRGSVLWPTGRVIRLTRGGVDLIPRPTGLTRHPTHGVFLGNTVNGQGTIYHLDWERALLDGRLDNAILNVIDDDLAINGTRPEFVECAGRWYVASADSGEVDNAIRYYDPQALATAQRTSDPGVLARTVPGEPWVQSLYWWAQHQQLVLVQNQREGLRWRLTFLDPCGERRLGRFETFTRQDQLKGFHVAANGTAVFLSSSARDNVWLGAARPASD